VRFLLVPVVAVLVLGLAGCSEETPGDATADDTNPPTIPGGDTGTETPTGAPPDSSGGDTGPGTRDLQPCDLLTSDEQAKFNLASGVEDEIGPARACMWQASGEHTITVGVIDDLGLDDVQSTGATEPMKVGTHDAVQYAGALGTCAIAIEVTDTSRVDVSGVANGDMTKACGVAKQAADLVEPKLPTR
jgi:Protein of unknown function (DUF3558)